MVPNPQNEFEPLPSSSLRLRANYWLLTHFSALRRVAVWLLVAISASLYGWAAWRALPMLRDPGLVDRIAAEVAAMRPAVPTPPQALELGEVAAVAVPGGTELLATVTNPNADRVATSISYEFRGSDGRAVASGWTWLMPGETRYAAGAAAGEAADVQLAVVQQRWVRQRGSDGVPPLGLSVADVSLQAESGQPARATFTVTNGDSRGYRHVAAVAVARAGGAVAAVGTAELSNLAAGEARAAAVTWYHPVPASAQVEVQAVADPFSAANVYQPE